MAVFALLRVPLAEPNSTKHTREASRSVQGTRAHLDLLDLQLVGSFYSEETITAGTIQPQLGEGIPKAASCVPPSLSHALTAAGSGYSAPRLELLQNGKTKVSPSSVFEGKKPESLHAPFPFVVSSVCTNPESALFILQELMSLSSKG